MHSCCAAFCASALPGTINESAKKRNKVTSSVFVETPANFIASLFMSPPPTFITVFAISVFVKDIMTEPLTPSSSAESASTR